jgi:biotin carboxyl carrier protein
MRYFVKIEDAEHVLEISELPGGAFDVRLTDPSGRESALDVEVTSLGGALTIHVDGRVLDLVVDGQGPTLSVFASGRRVGVTVESARERAQGSMRSGGRAGSAGLVTSPMPGKVVKVLVKEGEAVEPGRPLVVVEAMKMENELVAEAAGTVQKVYVSPGDAVEGGARLVSIG